MLAASALVMSIDRPLLLLQRLCLPISYYSRFVPTPGANPFVRKMGAWWVEAAVRGQVARLPLVNVVEHSQPPEQQNAARQH